MTRRETILREMGLAPLWKRRNAAAGPAAVAATDELPRPSGEAAAETAAAGIPRPPASLLPATDPGPGAGRRHDERAARIAAMEWEELATAVAQCRACRLCEQRKQAVLGVGDRAARWLFVGEGPGADEDERGEPFVGQAGRLLDSMLAALGLARGRDVYIANAVKCRPPGNRTPQPEEMAACQPFLARQIALIRPRLIVALGRPAAQTLLDAEVKIGAARGQVFERAGVPVVVTYHPAYLLRNLTDKAKAWEDLCFARATLRDEVPPA